MPPTSYESAADTIRRPADPSTGPDRRELVRLGSLAASSHNTQPWRFAATDNTIRIVPDFTRRCPVVDPDDAHLFKSLGCAAENVVHAAAAQGLRADVEYDRAGGAVVVGLTPDPGCSETALGRAIPHRQCTKSRYDGRPLDPDHIALLEHAGTGDGVRMVAFIDEDAKSAITEFVNRGNAAQLSDSRWREELFSWVRSNDREALATGDGLSGRTAGQPQLPSFLARLILPMVVKPKAQIKTDTENIRSSSGLAVFVSDGDDPSAWVETGRCYERFALTATALAIRNAFINQPIEVPAIRPDFEGWLGLDGEHAQLMVRFGTGPQMPFSLRRPVDEVLVRLDDELRGDPRTAS